MTHHMSNILDINIRVHTLFGVFELNKGSKQMVANQLLMLFLKAKVNVLAYNTKEKRPQMIMKSNCEYTVKDKMIR